MITEHTESKRKLSNLEKLARTNVDNQGVKPFTSAFFVTLFVQNIEHFAISVCYYCSVSCIWTCTFDCLNKIIERTVRIDDVSLQSLWPQRVEQSQPLYFDDFQIDYSSRTLVILSTT